MTDPFLIAAVSLVFLIAGGVKGVIGLGLPTVSLGLLAVLVDLTTAMALLTLPAAATNLWQAAVGGNARMIIRRLWPFMLAATITVWLGALALTRVDLALLSMLLGAILIVYAGLSLAGMRLAIPARTERWAGPLLGSLNGVLTGMTGSFVVPGILYLQALGLGRDALVQAMGFLFGASALALAAALGGSGLFSRDVGLVSAASLIPALIGMAVGQHVRRRLSEERFRRVFFLGILALGVYISAAAALEALERL